MSYRYKDNVQLAYDANVKRLRAEGAIVLAGLMNEALHEMDRQFTEAVNRGEILSIGGTREEMLGFLRTAADKQLAA